MTRNRRISRQPGYWVLALCCLVASLQAGAETAADLNATGVELYNAKRYPEAIAHFDKAHRLAPESATVRRNLCNAYQADANDLAKTSDFATAKTELEAAISVDPENPSPLVQLGAYNLRLELTNEAIFRLEEAIELDPNNVDAHDLIGEAYYRSNDLPSALAHWEVVREVQPGRPGLRAKLDKAYREDSVEHGFNRSDSRHFKVSYAPGTARQDLRSVFNILERSYVDIGRRFGGVYPAPLIQVIVYTAKEFSDVTLLGGHIGGLYDGKIRVPLLDESGKRIPDPDLQRVLNHEYTHVVVRNLAAENVPFWLNEGLAETFSHDLTSADLDELRAAREQGRLFYLADLEASQLERLSPDALRLAYLQAHATVDSLWTRFGARGLTAMMSSLAAGNKPEEALRQSYRRTYKLLEREIAGGLGPVASR